MNKMSNLKIVTFEEISREWLSLVRMQVKESSYNRYRNQLQKNILPVLGSCPCCEITTRQLQAFLCLLLSGSASSAR